MNQELTTLQELETMCSGLLNNAEIELSIDNTNVVQRIFAYKRMRELIDDLIFDMNDQYRAELDAHIEKHQTVYVD